MSNAEQETGYQVTWRQSSGAPFRGEVWPDREAAEHVAQMLRDSGWCHDVRVQQKGKAA